MYDHAMLNLSSESYTKAEQAARGAAHDYVDVLRRHVPGFTPSATSTDGLCGRHWRSGPSSKSAGKGNCGPEQLI